MTAAAACGSGGDSGGGGGDAGNIVIGTTDSIPSLDPIKCYSYYCGTVLDNVASTLISYQPGDTEPSPDLAAEMPTLSDDGKTYTFTLRDGLTFQDGSELTSEDVKFSLDRARWVDHPEGAFFLLDGIDTVKAPDPKTVKITLSEPDITFASKLAYNIATVLPSDGDYTSPDGPLPDDASENDREKYVNEDIVGSGHYTVEDFREGQSLELKAWDDYWGDPAKNSQVLVKFYAKSPQMSAALKSGELDVAYRHLTPEQRKSLKDSSDVKTIEGKGASIRYMVFNSRLEPSGRPEVRRAIAATIDRERIIKNVLGGAGEPLNSMIPDFFDANSPTFADQYKGKKASDFIDGKVDLEFWYSRGHYGDTEPALAQEIARQLEESGSFNVELKSSEWAEYSDNSSPRATGQYPAYLLGWYPDYLDADDYISPFYSSTGYLQMYNNKKMDSMIADEQTADKTDSDKRMQTFGDIQDLAAKDAPLVPLYVETPYAFARKGVTGVEKTMDASQVFRYYTISKSEQ